MFNLDAYELKIERRLEDIDSDAFYFIHKKTGAKVCVISNNDDNKVFYIGFRTPPCDDCGTPHIVEHTVLCGSEKFPVKDPFIELVKGSLNTFLNAMTYPDKTVYPVASCNDKDFANLMDVYLDSVLNPNIYKEENIFRQEGWHHEIKDKDDDIIINGVVYNEMKGAFSSVDGVMERMILNNLYPDTPYRYESGGDPDHIPELTYEKYLDFHSSYYHPSNSYIYLYGDMDVEEKLRWIDEEYLGKYEYREVDSTIAVQPPFEAPVEMVKNYAISDSEELEDNTYLSYAWSTGDNLDPYRYVAMDLLGYTLVTCQGAPVKQALIDAGIGEDIYGGYDNGIKQPMFTITARGCNEADKEKFKEIIFDVLKKQAEGELSKKTILSALNCADFKQREADFGGYPKGLMYGLQMMDGWLYSDDDPFVHMDIISVHQKLRELIETDYFENLIKEFLVENNHALFLTLVPEKGLNAKKEEKLKTELNEFKASLSDGEIEALVEMNEKLEAYQNEPSTEEDLDTIPMLKREDMRKTAEPISNIFKKAGDVQVVNHDYFTNGIVYLDMHFDAHHIEEKDIPYLGILASLLGKMDTDEHSFRELTDELNDNTGGMSVALTPYSDVNDTDKYGLKFEIKVRMLREKFADALNLIREISLGTKFDDEKRLFELLTQFKSRHEITMSETGHTTAVIRAMGYSSPKHACQDMITGIGYYDALRDAVDNFEEKKTELIAGFNRLLAMVMQPSKLIYSITCPEQVCDEILPELSLMTDALFADTEDNAVNVNVIADKNEAFTDSSQIQYVAMAGNYKKHGYEYNGAFNIYKTIMNYEYLWQNVRVLGGAYGCGSDASVIGHAMFYSYRDPNVSKTIDTYKACPDFLENFEADEKAMTKFIIGTFSTMDAPLQPVAKGRRSMNTYFNGNTFEKIQQARDEVLASDQNSIRALAEPLRAALSDSYICAIGNDEKLRSEANLFEHIKSLIY